VGNLNIFNTSDDKAVKNLVA